MWATEPQMAHPLAFMRAEAVQMCNNIKRDVGARGIVQGSRSFLLAHLQHDQPDHFVLQLASKACTGTIAQKCTIAPVVLAACAPLRHASRYVVACN